MPHLAKDIAKVVGAASSEHVLVRKLLWLVFAFKYYS